MNKLLVYFATLMIAFSACDHNNKPDPKPEPPKPIDPVAPIDEPQQYNITAEDVAAYYGWDNTMTAEDVEDLIKSTKGTKKIGTRMIEIKEAVVSDRNDTAGTFTLDVKDALVDGKKQTQKFDFSGFATRPADSEIGTRAHAKWKVSVAELAKSFDFDALYINGNASKYDTEYLKNFVTFHSSNTNSKAYNLSEKDLTHVKIIGLKYDASAKVIAFKIKYKGFTSTTETFLILNPTEYYGHKVAISEGFASSKYMRGVFQNIGLFYTSALSYDTEKYAAELIENNRSKDDHGNSLSFTFTLKAKNSEKELAVITKEIRGFKALSELKSDLSIASSLQLVEDLRPRLKNDFTEGKDVTDILKRSTHIWIKKAQFLYKNEEIEYTNEIIANQTGLSLQNGDLYLENPKFELISAIIKEEKLHLKVKLTGANELPLDDVTFDLVAHGFVKK